MWILIAIAPLVVITGGLSRMGLLNGFISASVGLTLSSWGGLNAEVTTLICTVLYLTSFFVLLQVITK